MTRKRKKQIVANTGTNSSKNGKQTPYFTKGGRGLKPHQDKKSVHEPNGWEHTQSPWNPGKCFPSKRFVKNKF